MARNAACGLRVRKTCDRLARTGNRCVAVQSQRNVGDNGIMYNAVFVLVAYHVQRKQIRCRLDGGAVWTVSKPAACGLQFLQNTLVGVGQEAAVTQVKRIICCAGQVGVAVDIVTGKTCNGDVVLQHIAGITLTCGDGHTSLLVPFQHKPSAAIHECASACKLRTPLQKLAVGQSLVCIRQTADAKIVVRQHRNIRCKRDVANGANFLDKRINVDREGECRSVHLAVKQDHVVQRRDAYCAQFAGRGVHDKKTAGNIRNVLVRGRRAKNHAS